ncbi:MYND-type domain-containing protein [Mycena kentingensis (nom. inval.)]|nr:MYND-type domain-containing protein [Mycena kentingensis (nom. inval.)]
MWAIRGIHFLFNPKILGDPQTPPEAALKELVPKVLDWMHRYDTLLSILPPLLGYPSTADVFHVNLEVLASFMRYRSIAQTILQDAAALHFLGSAWTTLLDVERLADDRTAGLALLGTFLHKHMMFRTPSEFEADSFPQLCSGAGGAEALGRLCAEHVALVVPGAEDLGSASEACLQNTIDVLQPVLYILRIDKLRRLFAFPSADMIQKLTTFLRGLLRIDTPSPRIQDLMQDCYLSLDRLVFLPSARSSMPLRFSVAVDAGFLDIVFRFWCDIADTDAGIRNAVFDNAAPMLRDMNSLFLSRVGVSRLKELNPPAPSACKIAILGKISEAATVVAATAADIYDACNGHQEGVRLGGCDNYKCGRLHQRGELKRCGACRQTQYCSKSCQKADWRLGHRDHCGKTQRYHLDARAGIDSRSFARASMARLYEAVQSRNAATLLGFFHQHGAVAHESTYTPYMRIDLHEMGSPAFIQCLECDTYLHVPCYAEDIARAQAADGRVQLHFAVTDKTYNVNSHVPFPFYAPGMRVSNFTCQINLSIQ